MPDPKRLLRTLEQSIQAFCQTPGRSGHVVHLSDAVEVFATGDLHGNLENFRTILREANLANHPGRHVVFQALVHGPNRYPRGGDKSHQTLDLLAALKCQFPRQVHMLLGNHELAQWTGQKIAKEDWDLNGLFSTGVTTAYGIYAAEVYAAYLELFAVVPLALRTANRVFLSHSLPSALRLPAFDPAILERDTHELSDLKYGGSIHALLWGRDTAPATAAEFLRKVDADLLISGHIACDEGFEVPNDRQLILDSLGVPACYCLFPTDRPLSQRELLEGIGSL
jgi:Calcineurin-like phosphoesterase